MNTKPSRPCLWGGLLGSRVCNNGGQYPASVSPPVSQKLQACHYALPSVINSTKRAAAIANFGRRKFRAGRLRSAYGGRTVPG